MSVREGSGGLSIATYDAIRALDAFGKDVIFVETVGAGQSEVDVMQAVQTVCLVTFPGAGDDLQANKAGIIEIADVFAVNKSDFDGAESTAQQLRRSLDLGDNDGTDWIPSIEQTIATEGTGISSLVEEIDSHQEHLIEQGKRQEQRRQQLVHESYIRARNRLTKILENTQVDPDPIENPYSGADSIMRSFANSFEGHAIGDDALFLYHR